MISDIALVLTALGVLGVVVGLRQNYRERLRQFEGRYVERYWKILDQLSLDALRGSLTSEICESNEKAIRSYISLCEDELEMRHFGYIADSTYELWGEGMRSQLKEHAFGSVWKQVQQEIESKQSSPLVYLHQLMKASEIKAGNRSDPLKMGPWKRTIRGLRGLRGV